MDIKIVILLCFISTTFSENSPKVHEDFMEQFHTENIRTVRQPNAAQHNNFKIYYPPVFNYRASAQQDHLRSRYAQQQQFDLANLSRRNKNLPVIVPDQSSENTQGLPVTISFAKNWQDQNNDRTTKDKNIVLVLKAAENNNGEKIPKHLELVGVNFPKTQVETQGSESIWNKIIPVFGKKIRTRKLKPSNFFEKDKNDLDSEGSEIVTEKININRQDQVAPNGYRQVIYVQPNLLKQNLGIDSHHIGAPTAKQDTQIDALNDLIGKNPNIQLEGLKNLLESGQQKSFIIPVIRGPQPFQNKDHTPISEKTVDIPNHQNRPNINAEHENEQEENSDATQQVSIQGHSLADLQAQLDASSKAHTEEVLAKATQEALAHVEAQHKAIALAQTQQQNAALAKIAEQNQGYGAPQALAYTANAVQTYPSEANQRYYPVTSQRYPVTHQRVPVIQSYSAQEHTPSVTTYSPPLTHQAVALLHAERAVLSQVKAQNEAIIQAQAQKEASARQHALTQLNYKKQKEAEAEAQHATVNAYQHVVLETQQQTENIKKVYTRTQQKPALDEGHDDHHQYAAKYAFGYRIKDYKMGNDFGHEEKRDGKSAKGHYHVLLPDGRLQKVDYYADDNGYHAKVTYENIAHH